MIVSVLPEGIEPTGFNDRVVILCDKGLVLNMSIDEAIRVKKLIEEKLP
jgi:hypothetical protein